MGVTEETLFNRGWFEELIQRAMDVFALLDEMPEEFRINAINRLRLMLHEKSPFKSEPVDCVLWIPAERVGANDYNPNQVAPPEMKLLEHSIQEDGYTQPIVAWNQNDDYEVVDGFHRHRVGLESKIVRKRTLGYLPVVQINSDRQDRNDRIAATIRHNRARGKHQVAAMSDIVIELKRRNWSDGRIGKELGMDPDEILRLCQITGLAEVFADSDFSKSWDIETPGEAGEILSDVEGDVKLSSRILHTWDKWECYRAGFYEEQPPNGMTQEEGEELYREFLSSADRFGAALLAITSEWTFSCEHYLTNERMNRIAWLGQASVAYALGIPSCCRGGYNKLTSDQQSAADSLALEYLNRWLVANELPAIQREQALSRTEAELY